MIRAKTNSLKTPYTNPNDLTDQVVRYWLNRTSNLYWKIPYEITGLYNQEAMEYMKYILSLMIFLKKQLIGKK